MKTNKKPKRSADDVLAMFRDTPAPLTTEKDALTFDYALMAVRNYHMCRATNKLSPRVSGEIIRVVDATVNSKLGKKFDRDVIFALKMLAYTCSEEGVAFIARMIQRGYEADSYYWLAALEPFGQGHPYASTLFDTISKSLPEKFLAVCLLDAANEAAREHKLKKHPFDSAAGAAKLAGFLSNRDKSEASYAVSACAALPFISESRRWPLVELARKHKSRAVRREVAWATAKMGKKTGLDHLVEQCLDPNTSIQAIAYLEELGKKKLVPATAREPDFAATAEMCHWLSDGHEVGEPPDSIKLLDKRTMYWPPTRDTRELRLFHFVYKKSRERGERIDGVGMVGSMTWSFFDETRPTMKPEEIYGHHCCLELELNNDPRAPKKRTGKAGWELVKARK